MQSNAFAPAPLISLHHEFVGAIVATVAWVMYAVAIFSTQMHPVLAILLVSIAVGRLFSTPVTQLRDVARVDFSRTVTLASWGGSLFGAFLVAGWAWSLDSGFEAWLAAQHGPLAYWNWF